MKTIKNFIKRFFKKKQKTIVFGYLVRNKYHGGKEGDPWLWHNKPVRDKCGMWTAEESDYIEGILPIGSFPNVRWKNEPLRVKITIEEHE